MLSLVRYLCAAFSARNARRYLRCFHVDAGAQPRPLQGVSKTDFCSQRGLEYQALALASPSAIEKFCVATKNESATNGGGKRLVRRGTIANGKLDGTAIANYWNLEKAPGKHASGGLAMA